jgi:hypothetical protein
MLTMYLSVPYSLFALLLPLAFCAPAAVSPPYAVCGHYNLEEAMNLPHGKFPSWDIRASFADWNPESKHTCQQFRYVGMALDTRSNYTLEDTPYGKKADARIQMYLEKECLHCKIYPYVSSWSLPGAKWQVRARTLMGRFRDENCEGDYTYLSDEKGHEEGDKIGDFHSAEGFRVVWPKYHSFRC